MTLCCTVMYKVNKNEPAENNKEAEKVKQIMKANLKKY